MVPKRDEIYSLSLLCGSVYYAWNKNNADLIFFYKSHMFLNFWVFYLIVKPKALFSLSSNCKGLHLDCVYVNILVLFVIFNQPNEKERIAVTE